jgi:hypothetical protein
MSNVTILPGGTVSHEGDGVDIWVFRATVNGQVGIVAIDLPGGASETEAAAAAKSLLEADPKQLEGVA